MKKTTKASPTFAKQLALYKKNNLSTDQTDNKENKENVKKKKKINYLFICNNFCFCFIITRINYYKINPIIISLNAIISIADHSIMIQLLPNQLKNQQQ